jgi:4-amino-4-deoxy-L-arabinose transferase-like glycosyltransferase
MIVFLIIILAAILRLTNLSNLPPGLYLDEVLYGLDAYSLIHTGKDIYGHFLPLALQSSGYYPPLFTYILAPFFLIFPLAAWVVRLPAALSGIAAIIATYFLAKKLFNREVAIVSIFLLAFLPWHVHLSRVAFLGSFGIAFLIFASLLFLQNRTTLSLLFFVLSTHIHYGYKLLAPALFIILLLLHRKRINWIGYIVVAVTLASHLISIRYNNALFRVNELSLTSLPKIIYEYLAAFSPQFLFLVGDRYPLLNPWGKGQLPLIFIPLLILGFYQLKYFKVSLRLFILSWLLLAPLPSALAGQGAHAVRNSPMIMPLVMIAALGLRRFPVVAVFVIINSLSFLRFYTHDYTQFSAQLWGQPERNFVRQLDPAVPAIISDKFYVKLAYYAFEFKLDPRQLQSALVTRRLGNLYFADE